MITFWALIFIILDERFDPLPRPLFPITMPESDKGILTKFGPGLGKIIPI
jgi:hypothetical protein